MLKSISGFHPSSGYRGRQEEFSTLFCPGQSSLLLANCVPSVSDPPLNFASRWISAFYFAGWFPQSMSDPSVLNFPLGCHLVVFSHRTTVLIVMGQWILCSFPGSYWWRIL